MIWKTVCLTAVCVMTANIGVHIARDSVAWAAIDLIGLASWVNISLHAFTKAPAQ